MVTVNLTPLHVLAGAGGLFVLIVVWRLGARKARRAADTARAGARLVSLAGRVLLTAGLLLGAQWLLITYLDNVTLQIVAGAARPAGRLPADPRVDAARARRIPRPGWWSSMTDRHSPHTPMTRAQRLASDAAEAAEVRRYATHPDVIALRVERIRAEIDRMCWSGILLGLAFTMTNVQTFAAAGATPGSPRWWTAWLLDPMVALVLLAILRAEQVTARYQVSTGPWVRFAKWFTLAATYIMNTWTSYGTGTLSAIVLHSVPPLVVFTAAEAITDLRDKLTDAVHTALHAAGRDPDMNTPATTRADPGPPAAPRRRRPGRRMLFGDYLDQARAAWSADVVISPAWVREVTGCSRGLSSRLAAELAAEKRR